MYTEQQILEILHRISKSIDGEAILLDMHDPIKILNTEPLDYPKLVESTNKLAHAQGRVEGKLEVMNQLMQMLGLVKKE